MLTNKMQCSLINAYLLSLLTWLQVKINVEISFFEIYNEKIHDLLASSKEKGGKKPTVSKYLTYLFTNTLTSPRTASVKIYTFRFF